MVATRVTPRGRAAEQRDEIATFQLIELHRNAANQKSAAV
jgi:hypothetical protein